MSDQLRSFGKSLFAGYLEKDLVLPFPKPGKEQKENLHLVVESLREFAKDRIDPVQIDRDERIPPEVLDGLKELGIFGVTIPEEYGGAGFSQTGYCRIIEEIARIDASLAVTFGAHASIGVKGLLLYGTEEQKKRYLPKLATGEWLAAFALTEPNAGSDAAGIQSTAMPSDDGTYYTLNGNKIWISNGGLAHVFTVFAKAPVRGEMKITAFLVTRDMEGVSTGPQEDKFGIRGSSTTQVYFDNVRVPAENVLGPLGKGFKVAMEVLNTGRLGLAAGCVGGMKQLMQMSIDYAKSRRQFNRPIAEFEMIQEKIAGMMERTWAAESMTYLTSSLVDRGEVDYSLESAMCKVYASEALWWVANETMQIAGGLGYSKEYPYEQALRDSRINLIFEGTNEILRAFIALAGMQSFGEYLRDVGKALRDPIKGFGLLTDFAVHRLKDAVTTERLGEVHSSLSEEVERFETYAKELHTQAERQLMKHGKKIIDAQLVQHHLADAAIDLFAIAAVVSRADTAIREQGVEKVEDQVRLTKLFVEQAWRRVRRDLRQIDSESDELRRQVARYTYEKNGYVLDYI